MFALLHSLNTAVSARHLLYPPLLYPPPLLPLLQAAVSAATPVSAERPPVRKLNASRHRIASFRLGALEVFSLQDRGSSHQSGQAMGLQESQAIVKRLSIWLYMW